VSCLGFPTEQKAEAPGASLRLGENSLPEGNALHAGEALAGALRVVAQTRPDFFGDIASLDLSGPLAELVERLDEATWPGFFGMELGHRRPAR
jgi:hypothetical protein